MSVDRRLCACIDDRGGEGGVGLDVIRERKRMGWMPSCITGLGTREKYERYKSLETCRGGAREFG